MSAPTWFGCPCRLTRIATDARPGNRPSPPRGDAARAASLSVVGHRILQVEDDHVGGECPAPSRWRAGWMPEEEEAAAGAKVGLGSMRCFRLEAGRFVDMIRKRVKRRAQFAMTGMIVDSSLALVVLALAVPVLGVKIVRQGYAIYDRIFRPLHAPSRSPGLNFYHAVLLPRRPQGEHDGAGARHSGPGDHHQGQCDGRGRRRRLLPGARCRQGRL